LPAEPDLSELIALSKPKRKRCGMEAALETLTDDDRRIALAALATEPERITSAAISAWFHIRGVRVGPQIVLRHRKGSCSCDG
jgi:hypothetical protein